MSDFLTEISEASLFRARSAIQGVGVAGLRSKVASAPPPSPVHFGEGGFDLIAEAKLVSPSEGRLTDGGTQRVVDLASSYAEGGAAVISVLTEPARFGGSIDHLEAVVSANALPVMRKDFLVDPIQVLEARASGASGVLLIARILPGPRLEEMVDLTLELGMFALVELFDDSDLESASRVFDRNVMVGVNCRDLSSLEVEFHRFEAMAPSLPPGVPWVAESGMLTSGDTAAVAALGFRLALVGSSLVSGGRPVEMTAEMIAAGRAASSRAVP